MNRRSFLAASLAGVASISAGCSRVRTDDAPEDYAFSLYNGSEETHSFRVRIGDGPDGAWFYDETFEMAGETGEEDVPIDGTPVAISITIDATTERQYPWPASPSEAGTIADVAEIWYEPSQDQAFYVQG